MKSTQPFQFPANLHRQHYNCVICQKSFPCLDSIPNKVSRRFHQTGGLCSSKCTDILMHATQAFVQGFLVSWVLCLFSKKHATESDPAKVLCGHDPLEQTSDSEKQPLTVKNETVETGSSSLTVTDDSSLFLFKPNCEEAVMNDTELDSVSIPVHFGMDLFHEPSLDGHTDWETQTEHAAPLITEVAAVFASSSQCVSDKHTVVSLSSVCNTEQLPNEDNLVSLRKSPKNAAGKTFWGDQNDSSCDMASEQKQDVVSDYAEVEISYIEESLVSKITKPKDTLNCQSKSNTDGFKFTLKRLQNKYTCTYCCKSFCTKRLLNQHIKSHNTESSLLEGESQQNFTCEFCAQIFMNRYSLKAHIRRKHSGEEPVECDICGKVQPGTFALSAHKKACHNFNSLCHICGAEFKGRTSFDKHMAGHEGVKRYFCDICGAGFVHNSSLNNHSAVHVTTKSYQCDICSQMFKVQHLLNEHLLKVHQCGPSLEHRIRGLKKMGVEVDKDAITRHAVHQCIVCGESLIGGVCASHPDNPQEVFQCPACGEMTSNIVLFYQHVKWHRGTLLSHNRRTTFHGEAPVSRHLSSSGPGTSASWIKCEVCSKTFKNFEYLSAHMHQHREARFACDICNKRFTYKCNLKTHMNTHLNTWQFECEACEKKFRDKYAFKKHQLKHTEPQFKCEVCGKALTRRPYLMKHYEKMHPDHQESAQL